MNITKSPFVYRFIRFALVGLVLLSSSCSVLTTGADTPATLNISTAVSNAQTGTAFAKPRTDATLPPPEVTLQRPGAGQPEAVQPPAGEPAAPTLTASLPASTAPATEIPLASQTPLPTMHPMMIAAGRATPYPGSEITFVEELEPGVNYSRYYVSYESEGLTIYALLTIPDGETPPGGWPGIVFNHGYIPPEIYRTTERYIAYVDWLARSGYVVFRIDYRGHDRSEGESRGAYSDPGYTADVLNAVAALKQYPLVDPERIGMWGHSMGGFLTLRAMVISPDIKAGVIWAGVVGGYTDLLNRWRRRGSQTATPVPSSGSRRWRDAWAAEYGSPEENPQFWQSISANTYLADISGPVQIHHGTMDESVPLVLSQILYDEMLAAGKPVEFYTYEGDNHNLSNSFNDAMYRTIQFFDLYLKAGL
jgi:dienelactone hydrolase